MLACRAEGAGLSMEGPRARLDKAVGRWMKMLALVWKVETVVVDVGRWTRTLELICRVEGVWEGRRRTLALV